MLEIRLITSSERRRGHAERSTDVVDVEHEDDDADDDEQVRDHDREAGYRSSVLEHHFAQREHGVDECGDEESDRDLARLVAQDRLHDAW